MTFSFGEKRSIKDENEFMPVTKKLNRLSIANSERLSSGGSINSDDDSSRQSTMGMQPPMQPTGHLMYWNDVYRSYNPSLDLNQNPTYYEANRVLFEAHQMRMYRVHQSHIQKFKDC